MDREVKSISKADVDALKASLVPFGAMSAIVIVWDIFALFIIIKCRGPPKFAKFLSCGLITFETVMLLAVTIYRFVPEQNSMNDVFRNIGMTSSILSNVTVGMMSVDRLFMVAFPLKYYRISIVTSKKRIYVIVTWVFVAVLFFGVRNIVCGLVTLHRCLRYMFMIYIAVTTLVIILSALCYIKVYMTLRFGKCRHRKSPTTNLLFLYLVPTVITLFFLVVSALSSNRHIFDITLPVILGLNCIFDPLLYVFWFKECQILILDLMVPCWPRAREYAQTRRMEINKSTYGYRNRSRKDKTSLPPPERWPTRSASTADVNEENSYVVNTMPEISYL